jgi:dihydroorotate dehydrogenase
VRPTLQLEKIYFMLYSFIRPLLFSLSPETAHQVTLQLLNGIYQVRLTPLIFGKIPSAPCTVMGLNFPNPVGLAAGMDKNGEYIESLAALGFGFIEVGTITPRPQPGNPLPRLFRLPGEKAVINRMGFNNKGMDYLIKNINKSRFSGILGVNLGKNVDTPLTQAVDDYLIGLRQVYPYADYVTINISSPNTPGLRQLQQGEELAPILKSLKGAQTQLSQQHEKYVPLVIKISPDLSEKELKVVAEKIISYQIDGVIATNTTLLRTGIKNSPFVNEYGGLSGAPLSALATRTVQLMNKYLENRIPIIASGGIMTVADAQAKWEAGASLIQIYTGLIYQGPYLIKEIIDSNR